jgi:hypothetical protein
LTGHTAGLLAAKRSSVKSTLETNDANFLPAVDLDSMCPAQFDGAFDSFRTGGEQKIFSNPSSATLARHSTKAARFSLGKT